MQFPGKYKLVTVKLQYGDEDVTEHLGAELRDGWNILSVTGLPPIGLENTRTYAVMAVVLANPMFQEPYHEVDDI